MRFDATRAMTVVDELGDSRFAGADGEARLADFVAERLTTIGCQVERLSVAGSRWPGRIGPWVGWLGYGCLITSAYGLILLERTVASLSVALLLVCSLTLYGFLVGIGIRPGHRRPPFGTAPVVIASLSNHSPASVRVVFQAILADLRPSFFHIILKSKYYKLSWINGLLYTCLGLVVLGTIRPGRAVGAMVHAVALHYVGPLMLAVNWLLIVGVLAWEWRLARSRPDACVPDRRGLAVLLELARSWPRTGSRPIEPVFVAVGGQHLDHAGSREVVRRLRSDWAKQPSLLILLLAPGAGEALWLSTRERPGEWLWTTAEVAHAAARGLWIPSRVVPLPALLRFWPLAGWGPVVALMGSNPRDYAGAAADPAALARAAQLATEIALRWAKHESSQPATAGPVT